MALISTVAMIGIPASNPNYTTAVFMDAIPVFRFIFMLVLTLWLIGFAVSFFEHYKINYILLLGIHPSCPIDSTLVFRFAAIMSGAWLLIFWGFLADFKFAFFDSENNSLVVYPIVLLLVTLMLSSSIHATGLDMTYKLDLMKCLGRVLLAPFFEVTFAAVVVGDVLCSFTRPFKDLVYSTCYYVELAMYLLGGAQGPFSNEVRYCQALDSMWVCALIMASPYYFRFLQCLRRARDQPDDKSHLCNAGKYFSCLAITGFALWSGHSVYWAMSYAVATTYCCVWDYKMDWDLELSNWLHRDHETYPRVLYIIFAINNFFMRLTWAFSTLTPSNSSNLYLEVVFFVLSGVEIYRRAQWSVIRVENEHLRNPSKFRVIDWVPPLVPVERVLKTSSISSIRSSPLQKPLLGDESGMSPLHMGGSPRLGVSSDRADAPVLPHHAPQKLHELPPRANAMTKSSRITGEM